uniref:G_PROTEIN_RECEP_F1_2 domain-containing protein n=1 Tax=Panagrellus redivivus TaxID=6233 RepID=A0A7E4VRS6_PANRE
MPSHRIEGKPVTGNATTLVVAHLFDFGVLIDYSRHNKYFIRIQLFYKSFKIDITMFTADCFFRGDTHNYVMIVAFCTIFCLSVVGNSIVVVVILQQKSMRSITNLYLLNLALSDLLLSVVCMPPTLISSLVYCWVFGEVLCKLLGYLQPVVVTASAYTLAAIALERYYAICRPLHSRVWHTKAHAMCVIGIVWLISIIANIFNLFLYELRPYSNSGINCAPKYSRKVVFYNQVYTTVVLLIIPLVLMTGLYGSVIKSLRTGLKMDIAAIEVSETDKPDSTRPIKSRSSSLALDKSRKFRTPLIPFRGETISVPDAPSRKSSECTEQRLRSTHSSRTAIAKQRLIRMLIVVVIIFFCCWTPSYIWWLLLNAEDAFGDITDVWNTELNTVITVLTYLSSCTNPITYCFLNSKFRTAFSQSFGCKRNSMRTRFQRVYAPHNHDDSNQFCRGCNYATSINASFRETSNTEDGQSKLEKRPVSLTYNMLNRLRNVITRKDCDHQKLSVNHQIPRLSFSAHSDNMTTMTPVPSARTNREQQQQHHLPTNGGNNTQSVQQSRHLLQAPIIVIENSTDDSDNSHGSDSDGV